MNETSEDIGWLQQLLDRSDAAAGTHLREVITADRRLTAEEVTELLTGMRLLVLATVTADGRPICGPVDGIFHRGRFHFGTSPDAVRIRHIRRRPYVSATHLPGEELAVTVHGRAEPVDLRAPEHAELRRTILDVYIPRFGPEWEQFMDGGQYVRIEPDRMYTFAMTDQ